MPDLLNISKDTVLAALEHELGECHKNLDFKVNQLRRDIALAVEAIPQAKDPLKGAEVVVSMECRLSHDVRSGGQINLDIGGWQSTGSTHVHSEIPKGKYRAFLFLHRVGDVE